MSTSYRIYNALRNKMRGAFVRLRYPFSPSSFKQKPLWEIGEGKGAFHKISEERQLEIKPSRYFGRSTTATAKFRYIPFQWYAVIRDAIVYNPSLAITSGGILWQQETVTELPYISAGYSNYFSIKNDIVIFNVKYTLHSALKTGALIAHRTGFNYLHAFCDVLSKITMLDAIDPDKKIPAIIDTSVSPSIAGLVIDFLGGRKYITLPANCKMAVEELYVFSIPAYMPDDHHFDVTAAIISPDCIRQLAERLKIIPNQTIPLLFVSRTKYAQMHAANYNVRNVINHNLLDDALGKLNAEVLYPEEHGWREQCEKFAAADRIVLVAGAACANLIFCRPGTKVLILARNDNQNYGFFSLMMDALGLDYAWLLGKVINHEELHSSYTIEPEDLSKGLHWLMTGAANWDGMIEVK